MRKYYWIIGAVAFIMIIAVYLNNRQQQKRRLLEDINFQEDYVRILHPQDGDEKGIANYVEHKRILDSLLIEYKTRFE